MFKFILPLVIFISPALTACQQITDEPKAVAEKYWNYLQTGNIVEAEKLLSTNSQRVFSEHSNRIDANTMLETGEARTLVNTTITSYNPETGQRHIESFNTVLVQQQGQWKIDVSQSPIPPVVISQEEKVQQLKEELTESMQENIKTLDNTISKGMHILNEALRDGSKEMGISLQRLMNEFNSAMQESIDTMKRRREQQEEQQQQPSQPDPKQDEGVI